MLTSVMAAPPAAFSPDAEQRMTTSPDPTSPETPRRKSAAYKQRVAERRRERKAEARTPRRRTAEQTVQDLMWALDRIPAGEEFDEWRKEVNRLIRRIRKSGARTPDLAVKAITEALGNPFNKNGATVKDLSSDTDIPEREVLDVLTGMISVGAVYRAPKEVPDIARGATIWLYCLTGKKPGTDMVLP